MTIKKKFIAIVVIIYVVLGFICPLFYYTTRQELRNAAFSKLSAIADLKAERIEKFFHSWLSDMITVRGYWNIKQNMPVLNRHIADLNNPAALTATKVLDQQLRVLQKVYNLFDVMLLAPDGKVVYSSNETHKGHEIGHVNPEINGELLALARKKAVFSGVLYNVHPGSGFEMYILGPAHNGGGKFIGFIAFELDMRSVYDMIQHNTGMGASGETIIARKVDGQITFINNLRYLPDAALKMKVEAGSGEAIPMQRALNGKNGAGISTDYRGRTVIAAWRYIPLLRWGLVAKIDATEAFAPVVRLERLSIGIFSGLALLLLGLFFYVAQSITDPLRKLQEGSRRLGAGEFSFRLAIYSKDEIGRLAATFNKMADALEESYQDLEDKITERTRELQLSHNAALAALEDVTIQKKRAEDALTKLEKSNLELKSLALFADLNPAPVLRLDHQGRILLANKAANSVFAVEYLVGEYLVSICPALEADTILDELAASRGVRQVDIMLHNQELLFSFYRVPNSGEINVYGADVSTLKETERRQQKLIRKQEDMRLTMLNIMDDLKKTTQRAEEATKAKSDFLANMSHEIRTPMNAILGMSYLAMQTELNPKQKDYLIKIDLAARSLLEIINDILDFSKIEAGKLRLEAVDFSLTDVLANVRNLLEARAREKRITLYLVTTPTVSVDLHGDPLRLGQILLNLTGNALKFTEAGEVVVSVDFDYADGDNVILRFCVTDSGIGLSSEQQQKLFRAFSQADTSITRKYGGTGLGLTISRQLVELMDGKIGVESAPGQGSSFYFTAVFQRAAEPVAPICQTCPDWHGGSALVVEANRSARLMLSDILKSFSLKVKGAGSGLEALKKLTRAAKAGQAFELVLLKSLLANEDAIDICRRIITDPFLAPSPVIIMLVPADLGEETTREVRAAGLSGLDVVEQSTPSALFETIMHIWNSKKGGMSVPIGHHSSVNPQSFSGTRVLVAEDNELNQQVARELLERLGIEVDIASDGKEAVNTAMANKYDLIFMDIQMPEMDGIAATREIREREKVSTASGGQIIPIIAMTAHAMAGDREKSLAAGMNDHINKPIDPEELHACLGHWLKSADTGQNDNNLLTNKERQAAEEEPVNFPFAIPGINLPLGLRQVAGNKTLYLELLSLFQREYADFSAQIGTALDLNDMETARRLVHTMKGAAGTIGASELAAEALALEIGIGKGMEDVPELLDKTGKYLESVLAALQEVLPVVELAAPVNTPAGVVDLESVAPRIRKLRKLLEISDMEAVDIFQEIKDTLLVLHSEQAAQLGRALETFNFKEAHTIITEIEAYTNREKKNNG
ncbi:MAG: response regulator [Deltaproteobacteria bacterium]|nr:response regulator [Deltaproteobacteria bacterium]